MPKTKRAIKARPTLKSPKWAYNRLPDHPITVRQEIAKTVFRSRTTVSEQVLVEYLMAMFDTKVETLQANFMAECVTFRCSMSWRDHSAEPKYGYLYPSKFAVSTGTTLSEAVILCYVNLCRQHGKWIKP